MRHALERYIHRHGLLPNHAGAILAVSGGVDSMVLLYSLTEMAPAYGWDLTVVHVNHQLRGGAAASDEGLVGATASRLGIDLVIDRVDVMALAQDQGISVEMAARRLRHDSLAKAAREKGASRIVTAHHADDQIELFFIRLLRGSSGLGLGGMRPADTSPSDSRILLERPFLEHSKADLQAFAQSRGIEYREDTSNTETHFLRNRIRHRLIPNLKTDFGDYVIENISRTMEVVREEGKLAETMAHQWLETGDPDFDKLPLAAQRHAVRLQLEQYDIALDFNVIETLRSQPNRCVTSQGGHIMQRMSDGAVVLRKGQSECTQFNTHIACIALTEITTVTFETRALFIKIRGSCPAGWPLSKENCELFDADRIGKRVYLRHWRAGDRFQPIGMPTPVKLQDLFVNNKVPREERHRKLVATTSAGTIFWVEGLRIGERFKVTETTESILEWCWR